jgi:hypothetical protein
MSQQNIEFEFAFNGKKYNLTVANNVTVKDLKERIIGLLGTTLENMKILGLRKGSVPDDCEILSSLKLAKKAKIMVLGCESKSAVPTTATTPENKTLTAFASIEDEIAVVEQYIESFIQQHGPRALDKTQNFELKKREELLTQRLIVLDGLAVTEETRPKRKALVAHILRVADKLESMKMSNS